MSRTNVRLHVVVEAQPLAILRDQFEIGEIRSCFLLGGEAAVGLRVTKIIGVQRRSKAENHGRYCDTGA
jgi:hypothetical protein